LLDRQFEKLTPEQQETILARLQQKPQLAQQLLARIAA
jgi:hypothetical protein